MKKFNLTNIIFLFIMTFFGIILIPLEIILLIVLIIYLPFEYIIYLCKYNNVFPKYKILLFIRFRITINIYKKLYEDNYNIKYNEKYKCFEIEKDNEEKKIVLINRCLKCEKTLIASLKKDTIYSNIGQYNIEDIMGE